MKERLRRIRRSAFFRYLASILLPLLIVFALMSGYLYSYVHQENLNQVRVSRLNRLTRIAQTHDGYISSMLDTAEQIGLSPYIESFSYQEHPDLAYDLKRQLQPYMLTNDFCSQSYLCFTADDHLYSATASMTLDLFSVMMHFEKLGAEELRSLLRSSEALTLLPSQQAESQLIAGGEARMVVCIVPLGMSLNARKGSMLFLIDDKTYSALFADAVEVPGNTYIVRNGEILVARENFQVDREALLEAVRSDAAEADLSLGSGQDAVSVLALGRRNWNLQYISVMREKDLNALTHGGFLRITWLLVILGALAVPMAFLLARRNARPIRALKTILPEGEQETDELGSIQEGVMALSRTNRELAARVEESLPLRRHSFVLQFVKGRFASREEAVEKAGALGMDIDRRLFAAILTGQDEENQTGVNPRESLYGVELIAMKAHLFLAFADTQEELRTMARSILDRQIRAGNQTGVAMSDPESDFSLAPHAYLEAAAAFDNRFVMEGDRVMEYASVSTSVEDTLPQARKMTDGISQALLLKDRKMLDRKMEELLQFLRNSRMSPFAFRLVYNDVISTLLRENAAVISDGRSASELYDIFSLTGCRSIEDLNTLLRRTCDGILEASSGESTAGTEEEETPALRAAAYMQEHFADPELSISALAESQGMAVARFSLEFKEQMRMPPLDYLTLIRIERSKALLRETELTIREIAERVGYYDASGFIRRFKQQTGETPLQYRRNTADRQPES